MCDATDRKFLEGKSIEAGSRVVVSRASGEGRNEGLWLKGMVFLFGGDGSVVELDSSDSCTTL